MDGLTKDDFTQNPDPWGLFRQWFADAQASEPEDPNAMALATSGADGLPDVRIVLLKDADERGFVFYTNTLSMKGLELSDNPRAALVLHWKSLRRQVRARGTVTKVEDAEADAYFATRARDSRLGAWASRQSQPLDSRETLMRAAALYAERFADPDGRLRATFELIWLSGWVPHESQQKPLRPGSAQARLADALGTVERKEPS